MYIDTKDVYMVVLDGMARVIMGNDEWDAYHAFRQVVDKRIMEGFEVYIGDDMRHHYRPKEP